MKILAVGAQLDDIIFGCGGMLAKASRLGHRAFVCTVTEGSAPDNRVLEVQDSVCGRFSSGSLSDNSDLINFIERFITKVDPDVILTHFPYDSHNDLRAIAIATQEAGRFNSNILTYETLFARNFTPNIYFDISDSINSKIDLLRKNGCQRYALPTAEKAIRDLAEFRALQSRLNTAIQYVEAFNVMKVCLDKEFTLHKVPYQQLGTIQPVPRRKDIETALQQLPN